MMQLNICNHSRVKMRKVDAQLIFSLNITSNDDGFEFTLFFCYSLFTSVFAIISATLFDKNARKLDVTRKL